MNDVTSDTQTFEYRAEMKRLLHLIAHSLYTHPEIFLRELISNASDALNKIRLRSLTDRELEGRSGNLRIEISVDPDARILRVTDNGIGMTQEDLVERLGTVASSGTLEFMEQLQSSGQTVDTELIGQFGVGFYSAFMVADRIEVETRAADDGAPAYRWTSAGEGTFEIEETEREGPGTTVSIHLTEENAGYAQEYRVREIITRYSNFVSFPIFVGGVQVNKVQPLWRKRRDDITDDELENFYRFVANDFAAPLGHLHLELEGRVNIKALLFVPASAPVQMFRDEHFHGLHLYSNSVFIQDDNRDLLPDYLKFVKGVVDTEDLPLNISREVTQSSPAMERIRKALTGKVLGLLEEWAAEDPERFATFSGQFGSVLKTGLAEDPSNRDRIVSLLRYTSTRTAADELTSLSAYAERMHPDQKEIYYVLGASREVAEGSPNLEYFRTKELEVLYFTDPIDVFAVPHLGEYRDHKFVSVEKAEIKEQAPAGRASVEGSRLENLLKELRLQFSGRVKDVRASKRLVESVATMVASDHGLDAQTERVMRMLNQDYKSESRVLEINPSHDLIQNLALLLEGGEKDRFGEVAAQILESALLLDGNLETPADFVRRATAFMVEATKPKAADSADAQSSA